jgi:hypothetical protein
MTSLKRNECSVHDLLGMTAQTQHSTHASPEPFITIMWLMGVLAIGCFLMALLNSGDPETGYVLAAVSDAAVYGTR